MVTCICQNCNIEFHLNKTRSKNRKYCSRKCMGESYKAPLIETPCEICGNPTFRTQSRLDYTSHHYCSRDCSNEGFKGRFVGADNGNWKGGSIDSRGPNWATIREQVRSSHGDACADCGMTNNDHISTYDVALHVHHITPFRLTQDNSPSNLIPLCIPCHRKAEDAFNKTLTPMERLLMQKHTEIAQSNGTDKKRDRTVPCPTCGGRKTKKSKECRSCSFKTRYPPQPKRLCPTCGTEISKKSKGCQQCYFDRIAISEPPLCIDCGKQTKLHTSTRCHPCSARRNGKLYGGKKRNP